MEQGTAGLFALFLFFSFLRGFASICREQARARLIRARIQLSSPVFPLSSRSYAAQGQKGDEGGQAGLRVPSAHTPRLSLQAAGRWARVCALTRVHSDLETLPCARAPPFRSATHHQVHRNNCTNTNRRSAGRARVFPSAVIAWVLYTYTQVISSGVGVRWEAFLTLSSRLHSLSLHRCRGHFKPESIVASSDAAGKKNARARGQVRRTRGNSRPRPAGFTIDFPHVREIAPSTQLKRVHHWHQPL